MEPTSEYVKFKLNLVDKTYELFIKRMDIWEDQFYKIKYGCVLLVVSLIGLNLSSGLPKISLNILALISSLGFWVFEASLRTTFFRYVAKLDILTDVINNQKIMEQVLLANNLESLRVLDFDIRFKALREPLIEYTKIAFPEKSLEEIKKIVDDTIQQKRKLASIWNSIKLKNNLFFYGTLVSLQIIALILFYL